MRNLTAISFIVWIVSLVFVVILIFNQQYLLALSYFILLVLTGSLLYMLHKQEKTLEIIHEDFKKIDVESIKKGVTKSESTQTNKLLNGFNAELKLEEYKTEQEKRYRELSKKLLELENKLNEKFDLLGKSILKLSKKKES